MGKMTAQQERFITAYFDCLNGAEAARRAGYSKRTARQMAYKLRKLSAFKDAMNAWNKELDRKKEAIFEARRFTLLDKS